MATFNHNPFRRPWRLSTPSPSRARSRSRSRPPQQTEPDDQESPGGPDRNLPSFTPGEETEENCDPEQGNMDDNSSDKEDVIEDVSTTPRKAVSLAGKKQEKTCDMEAPSYRSLPAQEQRRHRMPSSVMPSFKIAPVDGETNIPKLRAAIRGLARCLGADLNSRFDPAYYIKVLEGAHGQLFVKLENILRNQKHQPTWASLIESMTHEPRPTRSSFLSRKAALELKPQNKPGQTEPLHVYVDRWISEVSQIFGDAALEEQNTYLPEALLDRVGTLYALDLTARVIMENQIHKEQKMGFTAFSSLLTLKDFMTRIVPASSPTPSLSSYIIQPTTMGVPHASQLPAYVCRDFQRGQCYRSPCRYPHPEPRLPISTGEGYPQPSTERD